MALSLTRDGLGSIERIIAAVTARRDLLALRYGPLYRALRLQLPSILFSCLASYLCATNSQLRDAIQALAEDWSQASFSTFGSVIRLLSAFFDLALFSATVTFCSVFVVKNIVGGIYKSPGRQGKLLRSIGISFGLAPGIALAIRAIEMTRSDGQQVVNELALIAGLSIAAACCGVAFALNYVQRDDGRVIAFMRVAIVGSCLAWVMGIIGFSALPFQWGEIWGPFSTFFIGLAFWLFVITLLVWARQAWRLPLITVAVLCAIAVQWFNWQHCREVRLSSVAMRDTGAKLANNAKVPSNSKTDFLFWLKSRHDYSQYEKLKKPYPVILVAAEGGGIRAATFTALALAKLDEICERDVNGENGMDFSDHVYVMSGVSGGSVGLGFYRAILELDKAHPEIKLPRNKRLEQLLARDYLSGSLGRLLFTDLPTSGLPIRPHWVDRSAALSTSFVQAWKDTTAEWGVPNSSTLENRLSDFDIGSGPNLLLNATSVSKQSPFAMSRLCLNIHSYSLQNFSDQCDLTLADAMGLSARFPGISSAGVLRWPGTKPKTWKQDAFVDGGYFDNSGLESLNRVLQAIENGLLAHPEIKVRFLVIRIGSDLTEKTLDEKNMIKALPAGSDDLSPLLSATTVYLSTIVNSERRLFDRVDAVRYRHFWSHQSSQDQDLKFASLAYVPIVLNYRKTGDKDDKLPLGWIISRRSISNIGGAIGDPEADAPLERDLLGSDNQSMLWRTRFWLLDNPAKFYRFPTVNPVHDDN